MKPVTEASHRADSGGFARGSGSQRAAGSVIGGSYRILGPLGAGSSSHVFAAEHVRIGRRVAIKILRPELAENPRATQRFRREAKAMARLQNEHIVDVLDCGELDDRTPYLVTELLEGEDLRSLMRREGALPVRRACQLALDVCAALTAVHAAGLVHRDLKPENLFVSRRCTGEDWCKVLDFGVAKMEASLATAQDTIVGTVRYMAPEQLSNNAAIGPATDIYALGAILYECLTGSPPYTEKTIQELMFAVMNREPPPLRAQRPHLPSSLARAVHRALEKDPQRRPPSAAALAASLAHHGSSSTNEDDAQTSTLADTHELQPSAQRARADHSLLRSWVPVALALGSGVAFGWIARPAPSSERSDARAPQSPSAEHLAAPAVSALTSAPTLSSGPAAHKEPPASKNARGMPTTGESARAERGHPRSRDVLRPEPQAPARTNNVRVGGFDAQNPYGE